MAKIKINFTIDEELSARLDKFCEDNYLTRSSFLSLAVNDYLNARDASRAIKDMALSMRKIADSGSVDPATRRDLEDFERMAKMLLP